MTVAHEPTDGFYLQIKLPGFECLPAGDNAGDGCIVHKLLL